MENKFNIKTIFTGPFDRNKLGPANKWELYYFNMTVAFMHLIQGVVVIALIGYKTSKIDPDFVFISPQRELLWLNYALLKSNTTGTECKDLEQSSMYQDKSQWIVNKDMVDHQIFDFNNTVLISYKKNGVIIHTDMMVAVFFCLSFGFQILNGEITASVPAFPRIINYIEYSISSSLMVMIMAVNVGIIEIYTITSLAGLFFGMNIFGACTETILDLCTSQKIPFSKTKYYVALPHCAGWVLFLFAVVPVLNQYIVIQQCSNTGVPAHVHLAIALQVGLFGVFGLIQACSIIYRVYNLTDDNKIQNAIHKTDLANIMMSLVAKTTLAWTLIAPGLTVRNEFLRK
jgi:hypothetical protein